MNEVEALKTEQQRLQFEALLAAHSQVFTDVWKFGINTALRIGDLLAVTMDDVRLLDPAKPCLHIREQKTGKARSILLNRPALAIAHRRLSENPEHKWLFQSEAKNLNRRGPAKAINRRSVSRVFDEVGQQLTPRVNVGTHSMRKTRGYAMHSAGVSLEQIARVLNHSSPAITMRYIGLTKADTERTYTDFEL